ncbi:MAG: hypothetical protein Q8S18_13620 [Bacteroidales bacterium]|nr:hypothetical protein [Bacteroidales bacterium]
MSFIFSLLQPNFSLTVVKVKKNKPSKNLIYMKTSLSSLAFVVCLVVTLFTAKLNGQESEKVEFRTLFDSQKPLNISGFGGPILEFSSIGKDEFAVSVGGGGAVLVNNVFFGGYGTGLATYHHPDLKMYDPANSKWTDYSDNTINFGHGGFWAGAILKPHQAVHLSVSSKFGWGEISLIQEEFNEKHLYLFEDRVFVVTPQVEVEANLARWLKINVGVGYRFVTGVNRTYDFYSADNVFVEKRNLYKAKDFSKPEATISFLFGWFW